MQNIFSYSNKKRKFVTIGKKLQETFIEKWNLITAQRLRQAHYQILLAIMLKKFIKLNKNTNMINNTMKHAE